MRRVLIALIVIVIVGGALAYRAQQGQDAAGQDDRRLRTTEVVRGDVVATVRATGRVEAEQTARLNFASPGIVEEVLVEAGQFVQEGEILARLDAEAQRIAVEQAEWLLRVAELDLESLQEPPSESELYAAQASVNSAWTAYVDLRDNSVDPETLRIAELRYEQALAAREDAEVTNREANGSDLTAAQWGASGFSVEIARLQLEQVREGPSQAALDAALARVAQAQTQLNQLQVGPTQAQLDRAALAIEQAELRLARAQADYEDTFLRAPFAGVVTHVNAQAGGMASGSGLPAFEVVDLSQLHVLAEIDEVDVALVAGGQPVEVTLDALPDQIFTGFVDRIANVPLETGGVIVYEARLNLDEAEAPVRAGMTAAATITIARVENVLLVPNLYIRIDRRSGEAFVNVLDEAGNLVERRIELGAQNETLSEAVSGLEEGEVVAIDLEAGEFSFFEEE